MAPSDRCNSSKANMDIERDIAIRLGVPEQEYSLTVQFDTDDGEPIVSGVWLTDPSQCIQGILHQGDLSTIERHLDDT